MSLTKDELVDALRQASRLGYLGGSGSGGGGATAAASPASSGADWSKKFTGASDAAGALGNAALGAASKVAEGGARLHDATDALKSGFAGLGASGSAFGTALSKGTEGLASLGQNIDQNVDTFRKLSDTGLSFGNDIMAMKDQASAARLSIAEMSEVLQKNNSAMLGFGATSAASAKQLSKMSNEFFTSGLGEQLRGMGYTTKELNEVLAVSISGSKIKDLNDKDSQARALKSASALATEMDAVAKITGQSKQEQLDELRRKATDGQRMAAIDEAIARGGEGAKEAFDAISANGKLMGPQFQKLAEDMASMGRPSEGMEAAYGLLSSGAKKLMSEAGEAARSGDRERAAQLTKQAAAEQATFQQTSQYRTMAAQAGIKETQDSYAQGAKFRNALEQAGKELGPMAGNSEKTALALKKLDEQVKTEQQAGGKDDTRSDAEKAGASITRFAIDIESRGRDLTKTLNDQVIQRLTKDIGPELAKFGKALGVTAQKGELSKEDQERIAKLKPADRAAATSAAEDKKAASMIERELGQPMAAGYDKSRIPKLVKEAADRPGGALEDKSPMNKDLMEFGALIKGNQRQSDAALKVLNDIAAKENAKSKPTDKPVTASDVAVNAANTPGAMADIVKQIKKELGPEETKKTMTFGVGDTNKPPSTAEGAGKAVEGLGDLFRSTAGNVNIVGGTVEVSGVRAKAVGGIIERPELILAGEAGPEAIFNKGQLESYTAKIMGSAVDNMPKLSPPSDAGSKLSFAESMAESVKKGMQTVGVDPNMRGNPTGGMNGFDLSSISKTINTSISGGNTTISRSQTEDSISAEKELKTVKEQYAAERTALAAKFKEAMPDATVGERRRAMNASDESNSLNSKYDALMKPLEKKIESGIAWETTKKTEQVENTKALVSDELLFVNLSNAALLEETKSLEEDKAKIIQDSSEKIKADITNSFPVDTEFGDLDGAIAKNKADDDFRAAKDAFDSAVPEKINDPSAMPKKNMADLMGGLSFSPTGMPIMKSVDAAKKSITSPKPADPEAAKEAAAAKAKEEAKKTTSDKKSESSTTKESTLSDVVSQLNTLNKQMGQLLAQQEDLSRKQVNAVKSNNSNILAR